MAIDQTANSSNNAFYRVTALPSYTASTICGWFKWILGGNTYNAPWGLGWNGQDQQTPYITVADAILRAQVVVSASFTDGIVRTLSPNVWYFLAGRGTPSGFVGSAVVAGETTVTSGTSAAGPPAIAPGELRILGNLWANEYFVGRVAHLKVYDAILSDAELLAEMAYTPQRTANLNAYYPFATVATATSDASGNGRTLVATGTATLADTADVPPVVGGAVSLAPPVFSTFSRPRLYARGSRR